MKVEKRKEERWQGEEVQRRGGAEERRCRGDEEEESGRGLALMLGVSLNSGIT